MKQIKDKSALVLGTYLAPIDEAALPHAIIRLSPTHNEIPLSAQRHVDPGRPRPRGPYGYWDLTQLHQSAKGTAREDASPTHDEIPLST